MSGRRIALVVALGAWMSCTGAPADDSGPGSQDAATSDGGRQDADAAELDSASTDGAHDAPEASLDAGSPDWVSIAVGLPSFCRLERADRPEALSQFVARMAPCPGRTNCEISDGIALGAGARVQWKAVDGIYALGFVDSYLGDSYLFVAPIDGSAPIAAFRGGPGHGTPFCAVGFGALGEGRFGFGVSYNDRAGTAGGAVYVGEIAHPSGLVGPVIDDEATLGTSFLQGLWVASTAVVVWTPAGLFDVSTGSLHALRDESDPRSYGSSSTSVVGNDVLFADYGTTQHITLAHGGVNGGVAYHQPAAASEVEIALTDGHDVAWLEGALGTTVPSYDLWTAPFVESPTDLRPRITTHVTLGYQPYLGDGIWADTRITGSPPSQVFQIELYDLVDGRRRTWDEADLVDVHIRHVSARSVIYSHPDVEGERLVRFDPSLLPYDP